MRPTRAIILIVVAEAILCGRADAQSSTGRESYSITTKAVDQYHGLAIQVDTSDKPVEKFGPLIREIAALVSLARNDRLCVITRNEHSKMTK